MSDNVIHDTEKEDKIKKASPFKKLLDLVLTFAIVYIALRLFFSFVLGIHVVSGDSMLPTFENGDMIICTRIGEPDVGDIIVFNKDGAELTKRVVAAEGDTVEVEPNGRVIVNGEEVNAAGREIADEDQWDYPVDGVPEGYVFVLGDNREVSIDSRFATIGLVSLDEVVGTELVTIPMPGGN